MKRQTWSQAGRGVLERKPESNQDSEVAPGPQFIDVHEMARLLQVPVSWIYRRTRFNEIPCVRVGKYVRFDPQKVLAYFHGMQAPQQK